MSKTVKVGLIGAGFVTDLHAFSFQKYVPNAEVVAVASPTPGKAAHFAQERSIPHAFDNYRDLLALKEYRCGHGGDPERSPRAGHSRRSARG